MPRADVNARAFLPITWLHFSGQGDAYAVKSTAWPSEQWEVQTSSKRKVVANSLAVTQRHLRERRQPELTVLLFILAFVAFVFSIVLLLSWSPTHPWPIAWTEFAGRAIAASVMLTIGIKLFNLGRCYLQADQLLRHWETVFAGLPEMVVIGGEAYWWKIISNIIENHSKPPHTGLVAPDDASGPDGDVAKFLALVLRKEAGK